jgi:hypothetical protein
MNESLDVAMCEGDLLFLNITQAFLLSDVHLESPRHEYAKSFDSGWLCKTRVQYNSLAASATSKYDYYSFTRVTMCQ